MKKLVLDLERLEVQSFTTSETRDPRGTVFAHETEAYPCPTFDFQCSVPSYCVCEPASTVMQCTDDCTAGDTWYYSCNQTMGVCPTRTCQAC